MLPVEYQFRKYLGASDYISKIHVLLPVSFCRKMSEAEILYAYLHLFCG